MPITTNLTKIPANSFVMPLGTLMDTDDASASVSFDGKGNVAITLTISANQGTSWHAAAGDKMPASSIAISNIPNPNIKATNATIVLSIVKQNSLGVNVYFEVNGGDAGKQQNPDLFFVKK
jgi:hypothetical protein